jgi:annexin A6
LIATLCTKNNAQITAIKQQYSELFNRTLETDVRGDTSGWYQKLLMAICEGKRDETHGVNLELAKTDAAALYAAGEARAGTDEQVFIDILTSRNFAQLRATFDHYAKLSDNDIDRAVKKETSFNFKRALQMVIRAAKDPIALHARLLKEAMDGVGHDEDALIRIIVEHAETDLLDIADAYRKEYGTELYERIRRETRFNYRRTLLALFGEAHHNPDIDAKRLRKAMKGLGTNEGSLNRIIGCRRFEEKRAIVDAYKTNYNRDLLKDLNSETSGDYRRLLLALMKDEDEFAAEEVMRAVKGLGTDDRSLIELICTRNGGEMRRLKEAFQRLYSRSMTDAVRDDTSGDYGRLLVAMIDSDRDDQEHLSDQQVKELAGKLHAAGEARMGTDEDVFIQIMAGHSFAVLARVFDHYAKLCEYDIAKSIKRETSFNFKRALVTIVRAVREPYDFFAEEFERTMKGAGTQDRNLIRLMVLHAETDLDKIAEAYFNKFQRTLEKRIQSDTSGNYRKLLLLVLHSSKNWCERFQDQQMHLRDQGQAATHISITINTGAQRTPLAHTDGLYSAGASEASGDSRSAFTVSAGGAGHAPLRAQQQQHQAQLNHDRRSSSGAGRENRGARMGRGTVGPADSISQAGVSAGPGRKNSGGSVVLNISVPGGQSHDL